MTKFIRSFSHREAVDILSMLNDLRGSRYMVMFDDSMILLYDKCVQRPIITCHSPSKNFNQFYTDVHILYKDIQKGTLYKSYEVCKPYDHWTLKRLEKYYSETELKLLLYGKV